MAGQHFPAKINTANIHNYIISIYNLYETPTMADRNSLPTMM